MRLCVISSKECWQDSQGRWTSYGGFPLQMTAIASLFDEMTMVIVRGQPRTGGLALPAHARVIPLRRPTGQDMRRKMSVMAHLPGSLRDMASAVRNADVVHTPLPGDISFLGMLVALAHRKRLIARYGGSWEANSRTTIMDRVVRTCMRSVAGGRNVMLATGDGRCSPSRSVDWIFSTALSQRELDDTLPILERALAETPQLAYVGRLSPEKGVATLIRAMSLLRDEGITPMPHVTLMGDGPERSKLNSLVERLRCRQFITFAGQLDRAALSSALGTADICVQPSLTEGFSKAWLDAFAHGLPVLASRVGAASSVIGSAGERGWLVPPGDVDALANTLRQILADPSGLPAMRRRCRTYVEGCTLEAWAAEIGRRCARQWNVSFSGGKVQL